MVDVSATGPRRMLIRLGWHLGQAGKRWEAGWRIRAGHIVIFRNNRHTRKMRNFPQGE
jgi:hypothetical protein